MSKPPPCIGLDPEIECPFCGAEYGEPCKHPLSNPDPMPPCHTPREVAP